MRHAQTTALLFVAPLACLLALASCATTGGSGEGVSEAGSLDPERITPLGFYGGRCAGEPSLDGVYGVTGVQLEVGQTFVAELPFAAGTGYSWRATEFDGSVVEITDQRDRPIRGSKEVGSLQMCSINLTARKPGRTRVTFSLQRAWEAGAVPAEVRHTTIYVK